MASIEAVVASSAALRVVERKLVWCGGTVRMGVPMSVNEGQYPSQSGPKKYLHFAQNVVGGVVNFFVHGEDPTRFRGKTIVALVELWEKVLSDGRKFPYVDLYPLSADRTETHRISVMSARAEEVQMQEGFHIFKVPAPLSGVIVIAPFGSKIITKGPMAAPSSTAEVLERELPWSGGTVRTVVPMATPPAPRVTTGDGQLDRLIGDGWQIACEDKEKGVLYLEKMKRGELKTLVHHLSHTARERRHRTQTRN